MKDTIIEEPELVEDLRESIIKNPDTRLSQELWDKIIQYPEGTLLFVKKEIYKGIIIYNVEELDAKFFKKNLFINFHKTK